ncbi:mucin 2, oligomeric mucus/gel-forming [Rhizoctonia solani]|uniref:Mucin 2, oligomeric mucus/gel-forming n=1 Tax=Rhizoctonia solani TaxID=456999 RepID=A0A8H8P628_9AGAM|nr:mucin 2, oligomeric mucus/gel-forming [Rhizoctonia solani]QRW25368.1 mucin 2, oligomeric mucus/gel-forming [Rhizoctonia solani]
MAAENVFASDRSLGPTSPEEPHLNGEQGPSIREWTPPPPATPTPPSTPLPSHSFSSPGNRNGGFASASPVNVFSTPERNGFSTPNAASTPVKPTTTTPEVMSTTPLGAPPLFPARALSPIPARLRRMTPDPGSASDEVVFRGRPPRPRPRLKSGNARRFQPFGRDKCRGRWEDTQREREWGRTAHGAVVDSEEQTGDGGEVSSDGRDVVLFVPKSLGPPSRAASPTKSRAGSPAKSQVPSPSKSQIPSPSKSRVSSPSKSYVPSSPSKSRVPSPSKARFRPQPSSLCARCKPSRPMPPPMIPGSPSNVGTLGAEPFMTSSQELPRRPSIELREPIIVQPQPHMFSRMETASRDGSFHTARDSPAQSTDVDFPGSFPHTETPVHMVENQEGSSSAGHSAVTAEENPLVQSAMRAMVSRPVTMTITRRPSGEFAPSAHGSSTPARRAASVHSFVPGGLVPPASLAPSPSIPGLSHTPNSSNGGCSIPVRHDQHYSPPESLPESVTPPTDASRPPTERSNSHPGNESFYSAHAADSDIRLPVESWIAFTMGNMDANGLPITRATFDELQSSEDESAAVAERESAGQSLSDVGTTPSPSRSGSRHSGWLADAAPAGANGHLTVQTSDLDWAEEDGNTSAFSLGSDTSESNRRTVDRLQTVASIVHELNVRTPIPSASSSHLRGPPSLATTSAAYVTPPSFANPPPYRSSHSAPSRTLSPGAVSITFSEASPSLSTIPPPSLVVPSENRNWFADSLVLAEYRHSLYLRDDDQRALEEGEDVILYGGDWEHVGRRSESRATTNSAVPVEAPVDYTPNATDRQSRNKYIQFVLSVAGALRTGAPPRSQRMVENVLRPLRRQPSQPGPRYEDLYDEIGRDEAGALPDDDEIVEDFVRSIMTPQPGTPHRPPPPILIQGSNVLPWPALPSPVSPRIRFARSVSRQTTRSQATSITHITSSHSGYSSLIPPPPRPRPRSLEPHWLTIYVAGRWPIPDTYVTRRTYSSPSALGPPMPYLWRPICHISPERLWEITNFEAQVPVPSQLPPAHSPHSPLNARQHFPTPATTQNHATTYSFSTSSTTSSRSNMMLPPPPTVYPDVGFRTSHANLQIDSLSALPPLPPSVPTLMEHQLSNTSIPVRDHWPRGSRLDRQFHRQDAHPPIPGHPAAESLPPENHRPRDTSTHSLDPFTQLVAICPKPKFGVAGKVVELSRRIFRRGRRARLESIRSQVQRTSPET